MQSGYYLSFNSCRRTDDVSYHPHVDVEEAPDDHRRDMPDDQEAELLPFRTDVAVVNVALRRTSTTHE
jgi:hypothetical protein